ncbi:MAG: LPS export ABC transporter permease LptG [Moraxella sp.]|nr:LPS export ABC transporter permease LptG [Moraxella sp.]
MILSAYVRRSAFLAMSAGVLALWCLQMLFAYLAELDSLNDTYQFTDALLYILYRSPYFFVQFAPTGVLLGAVVGLGLLAGNSELLVMRAAGVSLYRIIGWVMIPALLFVALSLSINQWLLPISNQYAAQKGKPLHDIISINGYWTLVSDEQSQNKDVVYISYADNKGNLGDIKRWRLADGQLVSALKANTGKYLQARDEHYEWQLDDVDMLKIHGYQTTTTHNDSETLTLPIAPSSVHLLTKEPEDLSLTNLYDHRQLMIHQGTRSPRHELAFWQKLLSPFAVLSLVLIACSFVFGSLRSQSLGLRVVMALLTGLLFSYLTDLSGFVALAMGWSPWLMALLPIVLSALVGMYLLNKKG